MKVKIRYITPGENNQWDRLIDSSPQGSAFLLSDCLTAYIEKDSRLHLLRLGCFDEHNNLVGGQVFLHKKFLTICVQTHLYTWDYINTPIIAGHIPQSSREYFDIVRALIDKIKMNFFYYEGPCHPSIYDIRPLLHDGWKATPYYVHTWDLQNPENLINDLMKKKRFHQVKNIFENLNFAVEKGDSVIEEFIPLYYDTAQQIGYKLNKAWEYTFREIVKRMTNWDVIRFITCRNKNDGKLLGSATYVVNPIQKNAYGWQLAHIPLQGEKDFIPALYIYSIKTLSSEVSSIDISRGVRPSLYYYKDSLGTKSIPLFSVETPYSSFCRSMLALTRNIKRVVDTHI